MSDSAFLLAYCSDSLADARMIEAMLSAYGIRARTIGHQVKREQVGITVLDAPTEYHVIVAEDQLEEARAILANREEIPDPDDDQII